MKSLNGPTLSLGDTLLGAKSRVLADSSGARVIRRVAAPEQSARVNPYAPGTEVTNRIPYSVLFS